MITNLDQGSQPEEQYMNWLKFNEVKYMNWLNLKMITLSEYRLSSSSDLKGRRLMHLDDLFCKISKHHPYRDQSMEGTQKYQNFVDLMAQYCWFMNNSYQNAMKISSYWNLSTLLPVQIWKVAGMPDYMNDLINQMKDNKKEMNVDDDDNDKDVEEVKNNDNDDDDDNEKDVVVLLGLPNEFITYNQYENTWKICDNDKETKIIDIDELCKNKKMCAWEYGRIIRRLKKIIDLERELLEEEADDYGNDKMRQLLYNEKLRHGVEGHQNACMPMLFDGYSNPIDWILHLFPTLGTSFIQNNNNNEQRPQISKGMELDQ